MDKIRFETADGTAANIAKTAKLFPGAVTDGKVNFELLRSMLGDDVSGDEAYEFTWVGKREAIAEAGKRIRKTLRPCVEESVDWDTTENLYIEGDNLEVLKLLRESYLGKIKMIYIDPPYNTGNDFVYRDKWVMSREEYMKKAGVYDDVSGGTPIHNAESEGRFHSNWCSMIYPRLVLGRDLLTEDGVVFISIDDNEVASLIKICDEVFGSGNFVNNFIWLTGKGKKDTWSRTTQQYILCYAKAKRRLPPFLDTQAATGRFSNPDGDSRGPWFSGSVSFSEERSNKRHPSYFSVTSPSGKVWTRQWQVDEDEMAALLKDNRVYFGPAPRYDSVPRKKIFPFDENEIIPSNLLDKYGTTLSANTECNKLFGVSRKATVFDNPKPVELIKHLIKILNAGGSMTVMDFFSGSATTAHAVMQLNAEDLSENIKDGGNRKFIMVQLPEPCAPNSDAFKAGYHTICKIGKERIRRAGKKIVATLEPQDTKPDIGFRVFKLSDSNMADVFYAPQGYTQDTLSSTVSNIKPDRTPLDLLYGCLLEWCLPLSMPHTCEKTDGITIHTVHGGGGVDLIACFDEAVSEAVIREIAARRPLRAVFRGSSLTGSPDKINVFEMFKSLAPDTEVRVI